MRRVRASAQWDPTAHRITSGWPVNHRDRSTSTSSAAIRTERKTHLHEALNSLDKSVPSDRYLAAGATLEELPQTDGTLGYSPNLRHGVTGQELNDYDAILGILAEHHYHGWVSIEDGMNGMEEMAESLAFLRPMSATHFPG